MLRDLVGQKIVPANIYLFKVIKGDAKTKWCEICPKLNIKIPERCH